MKIAILELHEWEEKYLRERIVALDEVERILVTTASNIISFHAGTPRNVIK